MSRSRTAPALLLLMASRTAAFTVPALRTSFSRGLIHLHLNKGNALRSLTSPWLDTRPCLQHRRVMKSFPTIDSRSSVRMVSSLVGKPAGKDRAALPDELSVDVVECEARLVALRVGLEGEGTELQGCQVQFSTGDTGIVVWQRTPLLFAVLSPESSVKSDLKGSKAVVSIKTNVTMDVGDALYGRVLDCMGRPVDGSGSITLQDKRAIFGQPTLQHDMATISKPLHTGFTAVDSLTPIGRGQNMLLIGSESLGQFEMAIDTVVHQRLEGVRCVYVSTNGRHAEVEKRLRDKGCMDYTSLVIAKNAGDGISHIGDAVLAAAAGCAIAEHSCARGIDTLVIIDDFEQHKSFWDFTDRMLIKVFGVGTIASDASRLTAANSEMRAFYSSLLQRVGCLNLKAGGGSLSMLLLVGNGEAAGAAGEAVDGERKYSIKEFEGEGYSNKVRQRIQVMLDRGIAVTDAVLDKLSIPSPAQAAAKPRFDLAQAADIPRDDASEQVVGLLAAGEGLLDDALDRLRPAGEAALAAADGAVVERMIDAVARDNECQKAMAEVDQTHVLSGRVKSLLLDAARRALAA